MPKVHERPHFGPRQVRTRNGLKPGTILISKSAGWYQRKILIVKAPELVNGIWWSYYVRLPVTTRPAYIDKLATTDMGVEPYWDGEWNSMNHLLRSGRTILTLKEISEIAGVDIS